ncbi:MAG: shikimate dehydrogenase [Planctomycetota bacterium]|jgi:3-dehydroquinate dehydratase/shikimate dehydrogenase
MTYLAVPISAANPDQAAGQIASAMAAGAEILELRTDYIENLDVDIARDLVYEVKNKHSEALPIIVTCRDKRQGGVADYPLRLRIDVLIAAAEAGADFIDFEYDNFLDPESQACIGRVLSQNPKTRLILSAHDFKGKFADIDALYSDILSACPTAIPKLVYTANHINDCFGAFDLLKGAKGDAIVLCMGEAGMISRILAGKLGSFLTFASIDDEAATAPGQLTAVRFNELYRGKSIDSDTELFGVIADPVAHSASPAIHNACFADADMNRLYLPLHVEDGSGGFDAFMRNVMERKWLDFKGFSVTIPHKDNALRFTERQGGTIEPLAGKIGAVNTLVLPVEGGLGAYNTDYAGALDAIVEGMEFTRTDLSGLAVTVVGAGGVARAIVAALSDAGAKITIYNRTVEKAKRLAAEFECDYASLDALAELDAELIINCTSIGMHPNVDATPVPADVIKGGMTVFDTVYNPAETLLLKNAKKAGAKTIDGMTMFVNQARAQFMLFTNTEPNSELMRKTVCSRLENS